MAYSQRPTMPILLTLFRNYVPFLLYYIILNINLRMNNLLGLLRLIVLFSSVNLPNYIVFKLDHTMLV